MIAYSEKELTQRIGPLVYGVSDQDGVTKAIVRLMLEDRTAYLTDYLKQTETTDE